MNVKDNTILLGEVGSRGLGLHNEDSDTDLMGICIEPAEYVIGTKNFESKSERTAPKGERSSPGDIELTTYSLRKYVKLAMRGNPTVLQLMYLPSYKFISKEGHALLDIRNAFVTREAGVRFGAYLRNQKMKLLGEKSGMRGPLVEKFGYDTKLAMHAVRLGIQGVEYLQAGYMTMPLYEEDRKFLLDIRAGNYRLEVVLECIGDIQNELDVATDNCTVEPDEDLINDFLIKTHLGYWK
jgi:predicted nucleotidyltransferase